MIVIIDYGMGNTGSLENMIIKAGGKSIISSERNQITNADKLILPGVGAFDNGIQKLVKLGLDKLLTTLVLEKKIPILCICLGMQMITENSDEGKLPGLSWINARTVRFYFQSDSKFRIPHMGWNTLVEKKNSPLFKGLESDKCFYFVHSYYVKCYDSDDILSTTEYGIEFVSSIQHENIFATQFHPEKSHKYGIKLIQNFISL